MKFDSAGGRRNLGRQLLRRVVVELSATGVAARCGCSHSTISRLASGKLVSDSYSLRRSLEKVFAIPMSSWDEDEA